jgi:hypothetical protein
MLNIFEHANRVDEQNSVKRPVDALEHLFLLNIPFEKNKIGISRVGLGDHCGAEIDANAIARFKGGKCVTGPTTDLKNTATSGNEKLQIAFVLLVKETRLSAPSPAVSGVAL